MSNTTTINYCPDYLTSDSAKSTIATLSSIAFFVIKPICLLFDFFGHSLSFVAFYRQSGQQSKIYSFQLYGAIAKTVASIFSAMKLLIYNWMSGANNSAGVLGFRRSYWAMRFAAHLALPLDDAATTLVLFLACFTSIDRVYAIARPIEYKSLNRRRWESTALVLSMGISVGCCAFACFLYTLETVPGGSDTYRVTGNVAFSATSLSVVLSHARNAVWSGGVVGLVISGVSMIYLYHKKQRQISIGDGQQRGRGQLTKRERTRRESERALFVLILYQIFQELNQIGIMIINTMYSLKPRFASCEGLLFSAIRTLETSVVNASDFYVILAANRSFRTLIKRALPFGGGGGGMKASSVVPRSSVVVVGAK